MSNRPINIKSNIWIFILFANTLTINASFGSNTVHVDENVTIQVVGQASAKPDHMHIRLDSSAFSSNSKDALRQCNKKSEKAIQAIEALELAELEVIRKTIGFNEASSGQGFALMNMPPNARPAGITVYCPFEIRVNISDFENNNKLNDTIAAIFDTANNAGVLYKQPNNHGYPDPQASSIQYVLEDATLLRKHAITDAIKKADEIKQGLRESGVRVGKLLGLKYNTVDKKEMPYPWLQSQALLDAQRSALSKVHSKVTVTTPLILTYQLE